MASNSLESPESGDAAAVVAYRRSDQPGDVDVYHADPECPVGGRIDDPVSVDPVDVEFQLCWFCRGEEDKPNEPDFSTQRALRDLEPDDVPTLSDSGEVP